MNERKESAYGVATTTPRRSSNLRTLDSSINLHRT